MLTNYQTRDLESLIHPYTNAMAIKTTGAHFVEKGDGIYVYDNENKRYLEGMSGLWCCGLGFSDPELIEAAKLQIEKLPYYHLFSGRSHEPAVELAEKIKELAPGHMSRVFYQSSGSEANESQIKLAWYYNNAKGRRNKKKIISRKKGYHGVSIVSASLTGLPYNHKDFDLPLDFVKHTETPHFWREKIEGETEKDFALRLAKSLEELLLNEDPDTVAAFIAEPVMGAGGVIVPPESYFGEIGKVLKKYDILAIISGPEPQRSILEKNLIRELKLHKNKSLLLQGKPEKKYTDKINNLTIKSHLSSEELNLAMIESRLIICRAGYSTIMDLFKLQKNAVLIPTPGQTEQEYLSKYLFKY